MCVSMCSVAHPAYYRDTVIGYVHYYSNGTIAPVAITSTGVCDARPVVGCRWWGVCMFVCGVCV